MRPSITKPHRISNRRRRVRRSVKAAIDIDSMEIWGPVGSGEVRFIWEYLQGGDTFRQVLKLPVDSAEELLTELREQIAAARGESK